MFKVKNQNPEIQFSSWLTKASVLTDLCEVDLKDHQIEQHTVSDENGMR